MFEYIPATEDAKISLEQLGENHTLENEDAAPPTFGLPTEALAKVEKGSGGAIILSDVSFQYEVPRSPKALDKINLIIPEGKITAIVGPSGSGKTTLLKLLLKFFSPQRGKITLGGVPLAQIPASLWRQRCGTVMHNGFIFSDTIARNIALGTDEVDRKKLLHAVTVANIKEHIESLPLDYNTKVGSNGVGLSQGQKQRLLIARTVYKDPEYIFFDEATSTLDANNEKVIMENLNEFFNGKTVLVIAQRLSTVKNADQIVVLEKGRIVEVGTSN